MFYIFYEISERNTLLYFLFPLIFGLLGYLIVQFQTVQNLDIKKKVLGILSLLLGLVLLILKIASLFFLSRFSEFYWYMELIYLIIITLLPLSIIETINFKGVFLSCLLSIIIFFPFIINKYIYSILLLWSLGISFSYYTLSLFFVGIFLFFLSLYFQFKYQKEQAYKSMSIGIIILNGFMFNHLSNVLIFYCGLFLLFGAPVFSD